MSGPLIVNFDHATREGVVEGSIAVSDLDDLVVRVGDTIGVVDSGAGPYEAEVIGVNGDRIRARAPALGAPRSRPGLADADDIERWADTYQARSEFPGLVRRLLADTPGVTGLSIRAGRGVDFSGWTGQVDGGSGIAYVPAGWSCWEMSTSRDPLRKAQEKYDNRTREPDGADPGTTTFVFVTAHRWSGKDAWEQSRHAEGVWRKVRVLDADDLAGWLESRYGVHVWFSEHLGLRPRDVESLRRWWSRWSSATDPSLPVDLLLGGRTGQAEELRSRLDGAASVVMIRAGSREEATAFMAAALLTVDKVDYLSKAYAVSGATGWADSVSTHSRSILIPTFEGADVAAAVDAGHHVLIPMGAEDTGHAIELPRIGRFEARAAFEHLGIESDKADRYAVRARRSLVSLRRGLSLDPRTARPIWGQGPDADVLAALVLVGAWSENSRADRKTVASVVNQDYDSVDRLLRRWENTGDPPFRRSGNCWRLSNPEDAWLLLSNQIVREDLERWDEAVRKVLGAREPFFDLNPLDRFVAPFRGVNERWSSDLRRGLAQGVALLAALGLPRPVGGWTGPDHAESLVRDLLGRAGGDNTGKLWQQLADVLPLLAEAAPKVFLEAVHRDAGGDSPLLARMFTDSGVFASSPHVGLLGGLERLCWSPEHLPAAMDALLQLAKIDPGGQYMSRPLESACLALWPVSPQTGASLERRMDTLDGLVERFPNMGRKLLMELVPRTGCYRTDSDKPRFRDWGLAEKPTAGEVLQAIEAVKSRIGLMEVKSEGDADAVSLRLEELVESHAGLFGWSPVEDAEQEKIDQRRCQVVHELFNLDGTYAVRRLAARVDRPELVGKVVADRIGDKLTEDLLQLFAAEGADRQLALGWVRSMAELRGMAWAGRLLGEYPGLGDEARADILLYLPTGREVWDLLFKETEAVRESYWRRINVPKVAPEYLNIYMDEILKRDRMRLAVQVSWIRSKENPRQLRDDGTIKRVLESVAKVDASCFNDADTYRIGQLMDLMGADSDTVAALEGRLFLPLQMVGRSPTAVYERLRREPSFFVDLVCQFDRRTEEAQQTVTSRMTVPQSSAWSILQGWRDPPGYDTDTGKWDSDQLDYWVREARRVLVQWGRSEMGDAFIGEMLSGSPTGIDGVWPAEPVRVLIECLESEDMEDGLISGAVSSRGMITHRVLEGGEQERGLAGLFREMASKVDTRWLRTARVLRRLADHYDEHARRRDEQAERLADFD